MKDRIIKMECIHRFAADGGRVYAVDGYMCWNAGQAQSYIFVLGDNCVDTLEVPVVRSGSNTVRYSKVPVTDASPIGSLVHLSSEFQFTRRLSAAEITEINTQLGTRYNAEGRPKVTKYRDVAA